MDVNTLMAGMSAAEQQKLMQTFEEMQMKEQYTTYNSLVERCFANCVTSFRAKTLDEREEKCVVRCTQKFIKSVQRVSQSLAGMGMSQPGAVAGPPGGMGVGK